MNLKIHQFTHIGQRTENEDRTAVLHSSDGNAYLFVVADGLGGHRGGSLGAQTAIDTAESCWQSYTPWVTPDAFLTEMVKKCHAALNQAAEESGLDPRSTLAVLLVRDTDITSIHVGDSRVMQFSSTKLKKRTLDHSIAQLSVLRGAITEEEAATHPDQKKLYMHLGGFESPNPEVKHWDPSDGHQFVVCSDGFWELFPPSEIIQLLSSDDPSGETSAAFFRKLAKSEHHDNTTALFALVETPSAVGYLMALASLLLAGLAIALAPSEQQSRHAAGTASSIAAGAQGRARVTPGLLSVEGREPFVAREYPSKQGGLSTQVKVPGGGLEGTSGPVVDSAIPLGSVAVDLERVIEAGGSVSDTATEELRERGRIGAEDAIAPRGKLGKVGRDTKERLAQRHRGVTVLGAEVVVTVSGDRITKISDDLALDIDLESEPANDYPATILLSERLGGREIEVHDEGALVIMRKPDKSYRWAWKGNVRIDLVPESVVFDAETGEILLREPLLVRNGAVNFSKTLR